MVQSFDHIIIGAGSAGAALAHRLSEDTNKTICLIEAGPKDRSPLIKIPLGLIWLAKSPRYNWLLSSTPQSGLGGRKVSIPRGKVLGGSSAINGMIYIRGHKADYDTWAADGCTGWGYEDVLPYFKRAEANGDETVEDAYHGRNGPLSVQRQRSPNAMDRVFMEAANELQLRNCADFNVPEPEGVGIYHVTQKNGKRHSTAAAYLAPIKNRKNLVIMAGRSVDRLVIDGKKVTGVVVKRDGQEETLSAHFGVVLSAGAIGSPEILLRSGIGAGTSLGAAGVDVAHELAGVGQNLQDHVDMMIISKSRSLTPYGLSVSALPRLAWDGLRWITASKGILSSNMVEAGGFVRTSPAEPRPDVQFHFIPGRKSHRGRMFEYGHGVSLHTCLLRPESRGAITLRDKRAPVDIDLGLLSDERDLDRLEKGVRLARDILAQGPFAKHGLEEIVPNPKTDSAEELRGHIRDHARTVYHPVGTCAMGVNGASVVDPRLRVHGIDGLRVVDASVMPKIVSGNTNAPAIMIAEKAADLIKEDMKAR
jgi:choline dehydrogenase-like flavoprotein